MSRGTAMSISSSARESRLPITSRSPARRRSGGERRWRRRRCPPGQRLGQAVEPHDRAAEAVGDAERAVGVAVCHEHRARALVGERLGGQLAGLPGTDDHDVALLQRAEHAGREVHGDRGDAHAALADLGFAAHALAGGQRRGEESVGQRSGCAGRDRLFVRAADWPWISASPITIDSRPAATR